MLGTPVNGPDFEPALALQKGQDIAVEILCTFDDHKVTGVGVKNEPGSSNSFPKVFSQQISYRADAKE